jgi:hypothetical protein
MLLLLLKANNKDRGFIWPRKGLLKAGYKKEVYYYYYYYILTPIS